MMEDLLTFMPTAKYECDYFRDKFIFDYDINRLLIKEEELFQKIFK
jgi:hypothetical protein